MSQAGSNSSGGGGGGLSTLTPDIGGAVSPVGGTINLIGLSGLVTSNGGSNNLNVAPSKGILQSANVALTSSQVKNLSKTPVTIIPAPGPGDIITSYFASFKLVYGGHNAFTAGGNVNISYYDGSSAFLIVGNLLTNTFITSTSNTYLISFSANLGGSSDIPPNQIENLPIVLENLGGSDYGGNAANDNQIVCSIQYVVLSL